MKFTMEIELGNDAMQAGEDVAQALRSVAEKIACLGYIEDHPDRYDREGPVRDLNGHRVGGWRIRE